MARQLGGDYLPSDDTQCYSVNNSRFVWDNENDKRGSADERERHWLLKDSWDNETTTSIRSS